MFSIENPSTRRETKIARQSLQLPQLKMELQESSPDAAR